MRACVRACLRVCVCVCVCASYSNGALSPLHESKNKKSYTVYKENKANKHSKTSALRKDEANNNTDNRNHTKPIKERFKNVKKESNIIVH